MNHSIILDANRLRNIGRHGHRPISPEPFLLLTSSFSYFCLSLIFLLFSVFLLGLSLRHSELLVRLLVLLSAPASTREKWFKWRYHDSRDMIGLVGIGRDMLRLIGTGRDI